MSAEGHRRSWGVDQRLEFIEFRLFWEGSLNRKDIMDRFGVSTPQASADLALYKEIASANIEYDSSLKRFVAGAAFEPHVFRPNPDRFLLQLKAIAEKVILLQETMIGVPPVADAIPLPQRRVDARILRKILEAMRDHSGLNVHYHSMNPARPQALRRTLTPHAFASDGLRWHVRGYCHLERRFKDFVLSRFLDVNSFEPAGATSEDDQQWHSFFDVVLVPNPKLAESQQVTVALDYSMTNGSVTVPVRCALLYYFNKRLRFDVSDKLDNPKETPVVIANRPAFERALKDAGAFN